jgi:rhamnosyltransferase
MLRVFEVFTVHIADFVVADSEIVAAYYRGTYGIDPTYIPNGLREVSPYPVTALKTLNLNKNEYYLVVARLEPENNVDLIIKGFKQANSSKKLCIIGNIKNTKYCRELVKLKDERVVFLGGIYDRRLLMAIRRYCYAYIHGHEVGGTNPSLVEALSCNNAVLALNTPFNIEVLGDAGLYFGKDPADLKRQIKYLEANNIIIDSMRGRAYERYMKGYTVEKMTEAFLSLLKMTNSI